MGTYQFLLEIVKIVVSVAAPFAAYLLGRSSRTDANRVNASEKRLNEYYWPLLKRYMISFYWAMSYSKADLEARSLFFDLIVANSYLADKQTQQHVLDFYKAYLDVLEYQDENPDFDVSCMAELDIAFGRVIDSAYQEYVVLSKRLGYPEPLKPKPPLVYGQES